MKIATTLALIGIALVLLCSFVYDVATRPQTVSIGEIVKTDDGWAMWISREYFFYRTREEAAADIAEFQNNPKYVVNFRGDYVR